MFLCCSSNLRISFLFHWHLLRHNLQFLRTKALKRLLQSNLNPHKIFITRSIAVFFIFLFFFMFLFPKNHNRNPPELTRNLAEQTEKPIKTHCKPYKNRLWQKKRSKTKKTNEILQNWGALQFSFSSKMIKKNNNVELKKTEIFCICPDTQRRVCNIVCLVLPLSLCVLICWNLNKN